MGFKAPRKLYRLKFAPDTGYDGLEVVMTSIPIGRILELQDLTADPEAIAKDATTFGKLIGMLAGALLSWNLEDDADQPVPAGREGLLAQDTDLVMALVVAWSSAMSEVPGPLDARSTSGPRFREESLPMAPLSSSL